ncbi:hypothetical protein L6164_027077 [Bauhinia variegata]|uniref:Uncharacterized protein n=1 Tax=Bauhinia variegata TaxID=167791 RepID=A0ACB9LS54_BAUVA|nr:hypothetical protein L6164_027077 [Bauhinia variegata]
MSMPKETGRLSLTIRADPASVCFPCQKPLLRTLFSFPALHFRHFSIASVGGSATSILVFHYQTILLQMEVSHHETCRMKVEYLLH